MIGIILNLAQISVALLFVFLDSSNINAGSKSVIRGLALLVSLVQTRIFLKGPT